MSVNYLWLIVSFSSMGILDLVHSLMPPGQEFVWLHSNATFIGGLSAALIWLPISSCKQFFNRWFFWSIVILSIIYSLGSIIFPELTPIMLDENNQFTLSAKILNLAGDCGFIIAWTYFAWNFHRQHHLESSYFSNQYFLFGLAGVLF